MMRKDQLYGLGGFDPNHPSGNVVEEIEWDDDNGTATYRRRDAEGTVIEERPATTADMNQFGPPPHPDDH